jgi:hypothetical protein
MNTEKKGGGEGGGKGEFGYSKLYSVSETVRAAS